MTSTDPERLLDSEGLSEALREDLARAAAHDVGYDVAAGAARFEATLAQGGPLPPDGGGGAAVAAGGSAKGLALVAGLALVVGGGAIAWSLGGGDAPPTSAPVAVADPEPASAEAPPTPEVEPEPAIEPEPTPEPSPPTEPEAEPPAADAPATKTGSPNRSRTKAPRPQPPADANRLEQEMRATDRARQALAKDPARALSLALEADREFAGGLFGEDRQGIAILALFGLGRDDQARRKAKAFLKAHPRSSYADKIRDEINSKKP